MQHYLVLRAATRLLSRQQLAIAVRANASKSLPGQSQGGNPGAFCGDTNPDEKRFSWSAPEIYPVNYRATSNVLLNPKEQGYIEPYKANYNRDSRYPEAALPGFHSDTTWRFFKNTFVKNYELYPLYGAMAYYFILTALAITWSFHKIEVMLDRRNPISPMDWERARDTWQNNPQYVFKNEYLKGEGSRIPALTAQLNDEMLEAARQRGTRQ